jgi:hypothetical protein
MSGARLARGVGPVGGGDDEDALALIQPVHLGEQLVDHTFVDCGTLIACAGSGSNSGKQGTARRVFAPVPRFGHSASSSSKKMMHGDDERARCTLFSVCCRRCATRTWNSWRTARSLSPTYCRAREE